jgi:malate dehydrogenase (oxaloacetate-decarboxylating)
MFPIIYTPTEGEAISQYSRLFRRPEGCFLDIANQDRIEENLRQQADPADVDVIVVSDGEQVRELLS